jgi:hypothetical protein
MNWKSMDDLPNVVHSFEYCMGLADILVPAPAEEQPADPGDCGEWTY